MSSQTPTRKRYVVLGFTLVLMAIAYLDRVCISITAPQIKTDLGLNDAQMGYIFSAFTFAYALFEIPSGWAADRFGARLMLTRIVLWWSMMTIATGFAATFASMFFVRLLFGLGEAGAFPSMTRAYSRWLPYKECGRAFGLSIAAAALGGALTQPLIVKLLEHMHWRQTFYVCGVVGFIWAVVWYFWFRDHPTEHRGVNHAELEIIGSSHARKHQEVPWSDICKNRSLWFLCFMYAGVIYGWYFYLTWLPTYLLKARGFNLKEVGWLASLPYFSIAAGVFCGGWLSDHFTRWWGVKVGRRTSGLIGLPLAAVAIICAVKTSNPVAAAVLLASAAGLAALGVAPGWAVSLEKGGVHSGVVSGAMNMFGNLAGALSPIVVGNSLQKWGSWDFPLYTLAIGYVLSGLFWLGIDPSKKCYQDNKSVTESETADKCERTLSPSVS